ncbi:hypothetical protein RJ639_016813 [Escallonia herrerae]|uniref:Reverse transcriptase Ty1/copia-type domain-containing protein n=1 Tax=Escallonia herrerae TaxID=1293975 RepID=A0AA88VD35_9ASTE|nr:hypothetical protein RJ639_016813 [Escallonia herrerae]
MADGPNFLINTELSGLNNENLDPKSIQLSHDIDGNKNGGITGTKELLVYSRRKQIQRNETDASNTVKILYRRPFRTPLKLQTEEKIAILIVYVDDTILTGDDIAEMEWLKQCLASEFEIKDLGSLKFFLGIDQGKALQCHKGKTPIDSNQKLGDNKGDPVNTSRYQKLVGKLIYLSHTRPDIAFAVSLASQFMHSPHEEHLEAVYRILRYLKSSPRKGLFFMKNEQRNLEAYTDANWAGSITDKKSKSGYCTFVWGNLVTWRSKKQSVVARSSAEAEYRAMAHGICEMMWLKRVLEELRRL